MTAIAGPAGTCSVCGRSLQLRADGTLRKHWARDGMGRGLPFSAPCPGTGIQPRETEGQPRPIRYNITEQRQHGQNAVVYEVRRGHASAFILRVESHPRALHDTWPLRREIAKHAGVDPDKVLPQWDKDRQRRQMGRFAPALWLIHPNRDENSL